MLSLRTLGGLSVDPGEGSLGGAASQRKTLALLALLAAAGPRGVSRDKLVVLLWPESPADKATHRLTQLLYALRRDLGAEELFLGSTELRLNSSVIATDLAMFIGALEAGELARAANTYGGPFLDGFYLSGAAGFEHWAEEERLRLSQRYAAAVESLAGQASRRGDHVAAADWWRQLSHAEPLNSRMSVSYMEALSAAGDRAGALRFAKSYEELLRAEYDTEPDAVVLAAAERIRTAPPLAPVARTTPAPALAVLPFVDLTPEQDNEYFSDGMTEELTNTLARVPGLRVASRLSALAFKGKDADPRHVAEQLGVSALVSGSVRKSGKRIRLTAQLINAANGCHLWSESYDRMLDDVFALQEELSRAIVAALPLSGAAAPPKLVRHGTPVVDAYTLYLRGRYLAYKRTAEGLSLAIEYFDQALAADPGYALAQAGRAECWTLLGFAEFTDPPHTDAMPKAKAAALAAIALDTRLPDAHLWLGTVHFLYDWNWGAAEAEFRRALDLQPGHTFAEVWYAIFLGAMGRHDESLRRVRYAESLEPAVLTIRLCVARCYFFARLFEPAIECLTSILRVEPADAATTLWLVRALCAVARYSEALTAIERIPADRRRPQLAASAAYAMAGLGRRDEARALCRSLRRQFDDVGTPGFREWLAPAHLQLGEQDEALEAIEAGLKGRSDFMPFVLTVPPYDRLRGHPRFQQILAQLALPI